MRAPGLLLLVLASTAAMALAPPAAAQEGEGAWMLHIFQYKYAPDPMEVPPGETVTIMNFEPEGPDSAHTVTSVDGLFDVQQIQTGGIPYTFQAPATPGTYAYYCRYHGDAQGSGMAGTLLVSTSAAAPSPGGTPAAPSPTPSASAGDNETPVLSLAPLLGGLGAAALLARRR